MPYNAVVAWEIETSKQVTDWLLGLDPETFDLIMPAIDALSEQGPTLRRPLADRVKDSRHHNMKELRSAGRNIRILFAFDRDRRGILLIGGDKTGRWTEWYRENIQLADDLYDKHLAGEKI
jgi:hypothetical protein